jgi:hypothetical protein
MSVLTQPLLHHIPKGITDDDRESAILTCGAAIEQATTETLKRYWWDQMKNLIDGRSAAAVERMELAKGLRAA